MAKLPFKIEIAENKLVGCCHVLLHVGGFENKKEAEQFSECLAEWMAGESGWKQRAQ